MKLTFDVDEEQFREAMIADMKESYIDQVTNWKHEPDALGLEDALLTVIEFYSVPNEFETWYETIKEL